MKKEADTESNPTGQMERPENPRWRHIAAYLASCNAATLESMPRSWAKCQRDRFASIVQKSADYLDGFDSPRCFMGGADSDVEAAIRRCRMALEEYHAQSVPSGLKGSSATGVSSK